MRLTRVELLRFERYARQWVAGTHYAHARDLVHAAFGSVLSAAETLAAGQKKKGRAWRTSVAFGAHIANTIKGLSSDSRRSVERKRVVRDGHDHEPVDGNDPRDPLMILLAHERGKSEEAVLAALRKDAEIGAILDGLEDGMSAAEIRIRLCMTPTQYASARRRLLRKVEQLRQGGIPS
jgi:hypothetical protein